MILILLLLKVVLYANEIDKAKQKLLTTISIDDTLILT